MPAQKHRTRHLLCERDGHYYHRALPPSSRPLAVRLVIISNLLSTTTTFPAFIRSPFKLNSSTLQRSVVNYATLICSASGHPERSAGSILTKRFSIPTLRHLTESSISSPRQYQTGAATMEPIVNTYLRRGLVLVPIVTGIWVMKMYISSRRAFARVRRLSISFRGCTL